MLGEGQAPTASAARDWVDVYSVRRWMMATTQWSPYSLRLRCALICGAAGAPHSAAELSVPGFGRIDRPNEV